MGTFTEILHSLTQDAPHLGARTLDTLSQRVVKPMLHEEMHIAGRLIRVD